MGGPLFYPKEPSLLGLGNARSLVAQFSQLLSWCSSHLKKLRISQVEQRFGLEPRVKPYFLHRHRPYGAGGRSLSFEDMLGNSGVPQDSYAGTNLLSRFYKVGTLNFS